IRSAADTTRDRLIVEEEPEFVLDVAAVTTEVSEPNLTEVPELDTIEAPEPDTTVAFSDEERALLSCLLEQNSVPAFERAHQVMASLLIESINDKLMNVIGDVVIDASSDEPQIYEDYLDDIRELLHA
uniref:tellurite resistance TerB C-terminal domain-containing protein n=1 Tax=uncultured Olegusella sp. TaxID=1979846 RepID=UPI002603D07E